MCHVIMVNTPTFLVLYTEPWVLPKTGFCPAGHQTKQALQNLCIVHCCFSLRPCGFTERLVTESETNLYSRHHLSIQLKAVS